MSSAATRTETGIARVFRPRLSFSSTIGIAAAAMAVLAIVAAGGASYRVLSEHVAADAHNTLQHRADILAERLEADLYALTTTMSGLSANTLLSNALLDSAARSVYLEPFLRDLQHNSTLPVELAVTDFAGTPIAGARALALRDTRHAPSVLERGLSRAWLDDSVSGGAIVVAEPIRYARSPVPEGALLYRLALSDLLRAADRDGAGRFGGDEAARTSAHPHAAEGSAEPPISVRIVVHGSGPDGRAAQAVVGKDSIDADAESLLTATYAVRAGRFADRLDIAVEVATLRSNFDGPVHDLIVGCLTAAAGAIALALLVSVAIGRNMTRPLRRLEEVATEVVASGSLSPRCSAEGPREIARLGTAFNAMLARLAAAHGRLTHLAQFDSLTGLANRAMFHDRLREAVASAGRTETSLALLLLDLDKFKQINDTFGHPAGDQLLRQVSERLRGSVRETDIVARLGGDEFAIIATSLKEATAAQTLVAKICKAFMTPFELDGQSVATTASIGISVCSEPSRTAEELIREADLALYQVKHEDNGGSYRFFNVEMTRKLVQRKSIEILIRRLLAADGFRLCYQPKIDIASGSVVGLEALLRCPPEDRHVSIGNELIRVAESTGLINAIGAWAVREACAESRRWIDRGLPMLPIALNVSGQQLIKPGFADAVARALHDFALPSGAIELEITETVMMERTEPIEAAFEQLREMGVRLAIDDFGTGYSSLLTLKRFPVQSLKIDGSFVDGVAAGSEDAAIAGAIIALGHSLGLTVIAERVETEEQLAVLRALGCDQAQGYLLCPPLVSDALANWWAQRVGSPPAPRAIAG